MNRPFVHKRLLIWTSLFRIIGILILELIIFLILRSWGIWKIIDIPDQIFLVLGALVVAVLFGRKYQKGIATKNVLVKR